MTEPISRKESLQCSVDDWAGAEPNESGGASKASSTAPPATGLSCEAPADEPNQSSAELSAGASALVARISPTSTQKPPSSPAKEPPPAPPAKQPSANNNAERTRTQGADELLYADAGVTSSGDAVYAGVAFLKGAPQGLNIEVLSASAQFGAQSEPQAALIRLGTEGEWGQWEVRAMEIEGHAGIHNPDGSTGVNGGAAANLLAAEVTLESSGNSLTLGGSLGVSLGESSSGWRDKDGDGRVEYCARLGLGPVLGGFCVEPETVLETARELYDVVASDQ